MEFNLVVFEGFDSGLSKWLNINEPLFFEERLDDSVALVTVADRVNDALFAAEETLAFEVSEDLLASLGSSEALVVGACIGGHLAVEADNGYHLKIVALADFIVVLVVGWGDFNDASTVFWIGVFIGDDFNFTVSER